MDVIILTQVYNGEKTLRRTIESVLRQQYSNFIYYLSDNASTDGSAAIIKEYAEKDDRIVPVYNKINKFYAYHDIVRECCKKYPYGYWAMLDADDEYTPEFLEKMLIFIREYKLEIASCGFTAIDGETLKIIKQRQLSFDLIVSGAGFCEYFNQYQPFMRNVCSKLYSLALLGKCTFKTVEKMPNYGGDTIFATEAFLNATRIGIIKGSLHNVYYMPASVSAKWESSRAESSFICDDYTRAFLIEKCGGISKENEIFLHGVFLGSIVEMLPVLLNPRLEMDFQDRTRYLIEILSNRKVHDLLILYTDDEKINKTLRSGFMDWLLAQDECQKKDGACRAAEIVYLMYHRIPELIEKDMLTKMIIENRESVKQILNEYNNLKL